MGLVFARRRHDAERRRPTLRCVGGRPGADRHRRGTDVLGCGGGSCRLEQAGDRSRVLAVALLGPPLAWVFGMPIAGAAGEAIWRWAWVACRLCWRSPGSSRSPVARPSPPAAVRAGLRRVLGEPGVVRWSLGELLAYSAWLGVLLFIGALFVEVHGLSVAATGLALGRRGAGLCPGQPPLPPLGGRARTATARDPRPCVRGRDRRARHRAAERLGEPSRSSAHSRFLPVEERWPEAHAA